MSRAVSEPDGQPPTRLGLCLRTWAILVFIAVVTYLAYRPALSGEMLWDDNEHIPRSDLQSLHGVYRIWFDIGSTQQYYPLLFTWFWLQFQLWGDHMVWYHVVNLVLHLGAALLVYLILRKLRIPGALLATAIFALHPLQVESVAWVTEQKNTLSAVFYLGAMLAYLGFDETRERSSYILALGLFVAALLSKTVAVTLPPALLLIFWWQRGKLSWRRDVVPLVPFFTLSMVDGLFTAWFERHIIGAEGTDFELSLLQKPLVAGRATWFYLGKLVWPVDLMFIYPRWKVDPAQLWQWVFPVLALAALLGLWVLRKRWRSPLAGALFFLGTLFPVLGFLNVFFFRYSYVSDHFPYLACLGIIVPTAAGVTMLLAQLPQQRHWLVPATSGVIVGALAILSWRQSHLYGQDVISFYQTILAGNPDAAMPQNNVGVLLMAAGHPMKEGIEHFEAALRSAPNHADAHNNLGSILLDQGQVDKAIEHLQRAVELEGRHTTFWYNLGNALRAAGRTDESLRAYEKSIELKPDYADALNGLGQTLASAGRVPELVARYKAAAQFGGTSPKFYQTLGTVLHTAGQAREAIPFFEAAVRLQPDSAEAYNNLGGALMDSGQQQEALKNFEEALRLDPEFAVAHCNLGILQSTLGRTREAIRHLERAAHIQPDLAEAHDHLAQILFKEGRVPEAIEHFVEVLRLRPQEAMAHNNYGAALLNIGRLEEAMEHFQEAIQIQPEYVEAWTNLAVVQGKLNRSAEAIATGEKALAMARAQGQTSIVQQLEVWLSRNRDGQTAPADKPAGPALPP